MGAQTRLPDGVEITRKLRNGRVLTFWIECLSSGGGPDSPITYEASQRRHGDVYYYTEENYRAMLDDAPGGHDEIQKLETAIASHIDKVEETFGIKSDRPPDPPKRRPGLVSRFIKRLGCGWR